MDPPASRVGELASKLLPYRVPILFGSISLLCVVIASIVLFRSTQSQESIEFVMGEATASGNVAQHKVTVDVAGGVVNPGVYELPANARIDDAIKAAGGLSEQASTALIEKAINRASLVRDGSKIYIPVLEKTQETSHNNQTQGVVDTSYNISSNTNETGSDLISINSASQESLESLNGIGPATATKIIKNRPYMAVEELLSKKVVGQKLYDQLKSQLSL